MKTSARRIVLYIALLALSGALFWSCAGTGKAEKVTCDGSIDWNICKSAKITSFTCELGSFKKRQALVYTVAIKNTCTAPHRYRLNIFLLDQDKAAGFLVPRKGRPPVVKPGETVTVKIPFFKTSKTSKNMLVTLRTIGE